jgi:succinyl-diaminopimelate desuccinylase
VDELQASIDTYRDEHWDEIIADLESLVEIESVEDLGNATEGAPFGPGPRKALDQALSIAGRLGLQTNDCEGYIGFADLKGASDTQIGIIGHIDVVPAGPSWSVEPYAVTRRDGYLLGRGVIDDKGPIMIALHAVKFWKDRFDGCGEQLPYTIRVLFGANEETNMKDVAYYRKRFADPDFLFTPDNQFPVGYGESGICSGTLKSAPQTVVRILEIEGGQAVNAVPGEARAVVEGCPSRDREEFVAHGTSAHASTPELGENAIGILVDQLLEGAELEAEERRFLELLRDFHADTSGAQVGVACEDEHFGPLTMVGGVIKLEGGRILQSVDFRYPTTITSTEIEQRMNAWAERGGASFEMEHDKTPFLMNPDSPAVQALLDAYCAVTGEQAHGMTSKGGTYARCFTTGVSFGLEKPWVTNPDWVGSMHGPDEGVSEDLLKQAFSVYARAIGNLLQVDVSSKTS